MIGDEEYIEFPDDESNFSEDPLPPQDDEDDDDSENCSINNEDDDCYDIDVVFECFNEIHEAVNYLEGFVNSLGAVYIEESERADRAEAEIEKYKQELLELYQQIAVLRNNKE